MPLVSLLLAAAPVFEPSSAFAREGSTLRAQGTSGGYQVEATGVLRVEATTPIRFELRGLTRGATRCSTSLVEQQAVGSQAVAHRRCHVDERWTIEATGLEHEVIVHQRPEGTGPLRVQLNVEGPWHHHDGTGHFFTGPEGGPGVQYGAAWAIRADQRKYAMAVERVADGLELVVPESILEGAGAFPLIIDPVIVGPEIAITPLVTSDGSGTFPTIAWSADGRGYVVWVDRRRGAESALFVQKLDAAGGPAAPVDSPLITSEGSQDHPSLVWVDQIARFMIAYEQSMNDGGIEIHQLDLGPDPLGPPLMSPVSRGPGRYPSLGVDDAGLVMAYASDRYTLRVSRLLSGSTSPLGFAQVDDGGIVQTSISVGPTGISVGVETYDEESRQQRATAFLATGGSMFRDYVATPVTLSAPDRGTSVLNGPQDNFRYLVTRASAVGYRGYKTNGAMDSPVTAGNIGTALAAKLVRWGTTPGMITIRPGSDRMVLTDLLGGRTDLTTELDTSRISVPHRHLVAAQAPTLEPYAVWETGLDPQVVGAPAGAPFGALQPVPIPNSPESQTSPRVAMLGDAGVIVWRAGEERLVSREFTRIPGSLIRGAPGFQLTDVGRITVLGRHDVAMSGDTTLVVWRELGAIHDSLLASYLPNPTTFPIWEVDAGQSSTSDVGPLVRRAGSFFCVLNSFGGEFALYKLDGVVGASLIGAVPMAKRDTSADLDCPTSGTCVVAFVRPNQGAFLTRPGDSNAQSIASDADSVFLTHDDQSRRYVAWRTTNGYTFAEFNPSTLQPLNATLIPNTAGTTATAAAGHRPVVLYAAGSTLKLSELRRIDLQSVAVGIQPGIMALDGVDEPTGVVVYQSADPISGGASIFARIFEYSASDAGAADAGSTDAGSTDAGSTDAGSTDAGSADAGSTDAGSTDAGPTDAGVPDGGRIDGDAGQPDAGSTPHDAGTDPGAPTDAGTSDEQKGPYFFTTCGCSGGSEGLFALGLLLWWRRRR